MTGCSSIKTRRYFHTIGSICDNYATSLLSTSSEVTHQTPLWHELLLAFITLQNRTSRGVIIHFLRSVCGHSTRNVVHISGLNRTLYHSDAPLNIVSLIAFFVSGFLIGAIERLTHQPEKGHSRYFLYFLYFIDAVMTSNTIPVDGMTPLRW